MTLISRIFGFIRDMVIASQFGATASTDAFFVAFKIPNLLRRLFAEGAFSQSFIPVLSALKESGQRNQVKDFIDQMTGSFALILSVITGLGMVMSPLLIMGFAPGFNLHPEQYGLSVDMLRITFPYLFFICLTALSGGILNTWNHFAIPAITPILLNLTLITASIWLAPHLERPITALAWAVVIAGALQLGLQIPSLQRLNLLPRPRIDFRNRGVKRVLRLMVPAMAGASIGQINLMVSAMMASLLATGSISWLYYADRLMEFPLGVFGVGIGTVILPHLSRIHTHHHYQAFSSTLGWALRWVSLIGFPASIGMFVFSRPLIYTLFQRNEFSLLDAQMAARSLMAYSLGLIGFLAIKVLIPGFSAREDLMTPARYGIYAVGINFVLSLLLVGGAAPDGWQHAGLALAVSLAALTNAALLYIKLLRIKAYTPEPGQWAFHGRVLLAGTAMGALLLNAAEDYPWEVWTTGERVLHLALCISLAVAIYLVMLFLFGMRSRQLLMDPVH
jgi:putative peptidoglycan lipid II flippase